MMCKTATYNTLATKMKIYSISKRQRVHVFIIVLVCFVLTIVNVFSQDKETFVSYSEFTYPIEMDSMANLKDLKTPGKKSSLRFINPHPFQYIHFKKKCNFKESGKTSLLILVKSTVNNFHLRDAIRATWGKAIWKNVEIVYLLAYRATQQPEVDKEATLHGDIVQESFLDSYMNNTYKTIMGFNWAVQFCGQASHIVFVDDDHYLHIPNIFNFIDTLDKFNSDDLMIGNLITNGDPDRLKSSKWYVSSEQYPFDKWPPYLAGAVYLVSRDTANKMVLAFPYVKYLGIDDVYLGIVARKVGIRPEHENRFIIPPYLLYTDPSQMVYGEFKRVADFELVNRFLNDFSEMKMCAFSWKCQFAFLL
ncbi:beta-1,3-galactosyltransferase brn-like isoform X1 [Mizuhopecten yessoensis]|uniref:Hexosyltransferase n=1 Tax=Mizuhopecten yessoensis TaxID=6573 RepID=A0A210Q7D9_MIZYE|nr:beta-1,3-galactosyltransferase brn-like isoform X1 [Mizuhopecten yessoensis]XP_021365389.1 beta-1,3-galactosyltransferase brn-like isoform X1 [Mizuhopecten yessoensis]XP_021365390.1 beta-1,3-galactosyltransferase brn-like isoform X1 [Mizuhopecten yessoensis]XP_021365391.1 beta-1,3-galactosyltransferase brn-like isoform X1 [Mizuhopecten yessoensis]XP_021365392.1 beta-1,3-galactosyltransferase brn-like isoform X1 [Mizuhopecten yessoensis]XP_021365393.1 beta-1,3-galactosyltransferase brn-like 